MKLKPLKGNVSNTMHQCDLKEMVMTNFDKYDTSGDGALDKHELTLFFADILDRKKMRNQHNPEELALKFIHMIDLDGDEKLTREEIYKFYKEG